MAAAFGTAAAAMAAALLTAATAMATAAPADQDDDGGDTMATAWSDDVFCSTCHQTCAFLKCRVMSKNKGTWRCNSCNTKVTQLRRIHETWPTGVFLTLSEDPESRMQLSHYSNLLLSDIVAL